MGRSTHFLSVTACPGQGNAGSWEHYVRQQYTLDGMPVQSTLIHTIYLIQSTY